LLIFKSNLDFFPCDALGRMADWCASQEIRIHKILCFSATTLDDDGGCWLVASCQLAVGSW